jgi:hypothetical protein
MPADTAHEGQKEDMVSAGDLEQLQQHYRHLRQQYRAGRLTGTQFQQQVEALRVQDADGAWWAVDPGRGTLLVHDGAKWVPIPAPASGGRVSPGSLGKGGRPARPRKAVLLAFGMPLVTAAIWFIWGALHPVAEQGVDCLTPLLMAGLPIGLLVFQRRLDPYLLPLQPFVKRFPRALRTGMVFALPIVLGLLLSSTSSAGFGALRLTLVVSILGAYLLLHEPEVAR